MRLIAGREASQAQAAGGGVGGAGSLTCLSCSSFLPRSEPSAPGSEGSQLDRPTGGRAQCPAEAASCSDSHATGSVPGSGVSGCPRKELFHCEVGSHSRWR